MSPDPFQSFKDDIENEARKTADSSWDSPFHTLGSGATQAASGNHKHHATDIKDLPPGTALSNAIPKQDAGSGSAGTGTAASRDDHVHPPTPGISLGTSAPPADGGGGAVGTSGAAARADHQHPAHNVGYADNAGYATNAGNADTVDGYHEGSLSKVGHGHASLRVLSHDFGTVAASTTVNQLFSRNADEVPVSVYSVYNAVNYTWGIGLPDATSFRVYLRNQSGSSNAIGVIYIVLGKLNVY